MILPRNPRLALLPLASLPLGPRIPIRSASHATQGVANGAARGPGKRLGLKKGASEPVVPGNIIFRQRGTHWHAGENCVLGRDHTISALQPGYVRYYRDPRRHPTRKYIGVVLKNDDVLPRGPGAARRRRFGLDAVPLAPSPSAPPPPAPYYAHAPQSKRARKSLKAAKKHASPNAQPVDPDIEVRTAPPAANGTLDARLGASAPLSVPQDEADAADGLASDMDALSLTAPRPRLPRSYSMRPSNAALGGDRYALIMAKHRARNAPRARILRLRKRVQARTRRLKRVSEGKVVKRPALGGKAKAKGKRGKRGGKRGKGKGKGRK